MAIEDQVAQDQLLAFITRVERMNEEAAAIKSDIAEIFAEAKGNGFDVKIMKRIIRMRAQDANERREEETILALYMRALGMLPPEYLDDAA